MITGAVKRFGQYSKDRYSAPSARIGNQYFDFKPNSELKINPNRIGSKLAELLDHRTRCTERIPAIPFRNSDNQLRNKILDESNNLRYRNQPLGNATSNFIRDLLYRDHKIANTADWYRLLIQDIYPTKNEFKNHFHESGKYLREDQDLFFSKGNFNELRSAIALSALKDSGFIKDFETFSRGDFEDYIGVDALVTLMDGKVFAFQFKSAAQQANEFLDEPVQLALVSNFRSDSNEDSLYKRVGICPIVMKNKSITDLMQEFTRVLKKQFYEGTTSRLSFKLEGLNSRDLDSKTGRYTTLANKYLELVPAMAAA